MFNTEALEIRLASDIVPRSPRKETTVKRVVSERTSSLALKKQQSSLEPGQYVSDEDDVDYSVTEPTAARRKRRRK